MDISADTKANLRDPARIITKAGDVVVMIGRKILDFACELLKTFPNTIFGVIAGLFVAALVGNVPVLGPWQGRSGLQRVRWRM